MAADAAAKAFARCAIGLAGGHAESSALRAASCWRLETAGAPRRGRFLADFDEKSCLISTTDFFSHLWSMTRRDFGRIAATNAISDVYAMGRKAGFRACNFRNACTGQIRASAKSAEILEGGREVCSAAGIPVAGGHFIDTPEPIYGLAVNGRCAPSELRRNCDAKPEDILILTKPVGVGVYSAAFKKDALSAGDCRDMIATMTKLNRVGAELAKNPNRACHDRRRRVRHSWPWPRNRARFGPQAHGEGR